MRRIYRNYCNYVTGLAIISFPREKYATDKKDKIYCAIIDLMSFLTYFGNPTELYSFLLKKANTVISSWNSQNGGKESWGRRRPTKWEDEIAKYTWLGKNGREECSVYELVINTYKFTKNADKAEKPKIKMENLKVRKGANFVSIDDNLVFLSEVLFKLRTTVNAGGIPDQSGSQDGFRRE
jgi:hypothetical protein